jgi:predicted DNA-binding transcriptional regulator AlpA
MHPGTPLIPDGLYRLPDLIGRRDPKTRRRTAAIVPVSQATVYRWVSAGQFPAPIRLGSNTVVWRGSDVNSWIESRRSAGVETQSSK